MHFQPRLETDGEPLNLTFLCLDRAVSYWPFADKKILSAKYSMFSVVFGVCANRP